MVILCSKWLYSVRSGFILILFSMIYQQHHHHHHHQQQQQHYTETECTSLWMPEYLSSFVIRTHARQWFIWSQIASKHTHTHNDIDINIAHLDCSFSFHVIWLFHVRIHEQSEYILYLLFPLNKSAPASFSSLFVCFCFFFLLFFRNIVGRNFNWIITFFALHIANEM